MIVKYLSNSKIGFIAQLYIQASNYTICSEFRILKGEKNERKVESQVRMRWMHDERKDKIYF